MRLGVSSQLWLYFRSKERMLSLPGGCGVANWVGSCVYSSLVLGWNCRIWQRKILLWLLLSFCSSSSLSRSSLCSSHFACDFKSSSDSLFCYYFPLQGQVVVQRRKDWMEFSYSEQDSQSDQDAGLQSCSSQYGCVVEETQVGFGNPSVTVSFWTLWQVKSLLLLQGTRSLHLDFVSITARF